MLIKERDEFSSQVVQACSCRADEAYATFTKSLEIALGFVCDCKLVTLFHPRNILYLSNARFTSVFIRS
jgi:hypothetical protein